MQSLAIVWKSLLLMVRSPLWLIFTIAAPLIFTLVLGLATSEQSSDANEDRRTPVIVADQDGGPVAQEIIAQINQSALIKIESLTTAEAARQAVKDRDVGTAMIIPAGLSQQVIDGLPAAANLVINPASRTRYAVQQELNAIVTRVATVYAAAKKATDQAAQLRPFENISEQASYFEAALLDARERAQLPLITVNAVQAQASDADQPRVTSGFSQSSAGAAVQWVITGALSTTGYLVLERQQGTLRRMMVMPISRSAILFGNMLLAFLVALIQIAVVIVFGGLMGANWGQNIPALLIVVSCYALAMAGLAILFASIARTENQAIGFGVALANVAAPLAGAWFPRELMPESLLMLGKVLPSGWAMEAFSGVITYNWGVVEVLLPCAVMLAFAAAFFAIGVSRFKFE